MELYCNLILGFGLICTGYVGDYEIRFLDLRESTLGYHTYRTGILTYRYESSGGTVLGGQFDWGGRLQKSNGGAQRLAQHGRKPCF